MVLTQALVRTHTHTQTHTSSILDIFKTAKENHGYFQNKDLKIYLAGMTYHYRHFIYAYSDHITPPK